MAVLRYIGKGIVPAIWFLLLALVAKQFCFVDGQIEWFRIMLLYGFPYGFPYLVLYVPKWGGISGGIGALALEAILAALFGFPIAVIAFVRAVVYLIASPIRFIRSHKK